MRSNRRATAEAVTECARNIYQEARDWYKVAETKAQILLALDGAAITAISAAVFGKPGEVKAFVAELPWQSTAALCLSALAFVASVFCAVVCVWSRLVSGINAPASEPLRDVAADGFALLDVGVQTSVVGSDRLCVRLCRWCFV